VVAVVGRLSPEKGHSYFVEAMAQVARAIPGAQGLIVGDGQEEERLRAKVATMELGPAICFAGYRRDMDRIYSAIDLLVLPSLSEGLPNVALEAMAHGCPVVGTRVGGVPEAVEDGVSGLLVAPADGHALAQATVTLLRNPARRASMGAAARERVERSFSVRARAARILSVYSDVLQRCGPTLGAAPRPQRTHEGVPG
jgi:glycosyltransferase involved in cell wall biosynthesis